jgi:N-acetylglucosaminyl-diphospho-decaprenol L-rhamnosyltransferase
VFALSADIKGERSAVPVDIAFITVNFNTLQWITRLADFFKTLEAPFTFNFTVVDNCSEDGSREFLQAHAEINYLPMGENIGYGRAINRGVEATDGKYVCVTNTDVVLNRDALIEIWKFLEERSDAGVCAPRITYENGRSQGMVFSKSLFSHYANWFGKLQASYANFKFAKAADPLRVDGVLGAFFIIRRSAIPPPTLFDEDFFFFYEDSALAHTLLNRGVPCYVLPSATIIHIGGQSRSTNSISYFYESKYKYLKKFYGPFHARAVQFMDRVRIFRKWSIYSLLSMVSTSERVKFKQRFYKIAWDTARLK